MRIPHHLIRTPSGTYAFRQSVPSDLQVVIGRKLIKQTFRTANLASARLRAIVLASGHCDCTIGLRDHTEAERALHLPGSKSSLAELIAERQATQARKHLDDQTSVPVLKRHRPVRI
ncbi:DUF6538 domain-containing protein [Xanthomonas arboricola]|jgi:metal-dependent hydrolase (beta-lactamase superfamily II)|uniref:DUF6538 domain-containing protein n=1 Tax=Xanthomonas arboricola TaxID=56448 RepID=UPI0028054EAD|nr:DUF6538 domain-containing protein [Xanthomonas arboricola]